MALAEIIPVVNVIPKKVKDDENPALTTPLTYIGTPQELDAELGTHLVGYVECHTQLGSTLAQAKAEMEAAAKTAQEETRKKAAERGKKGTEKPGTNGDSAPEATATPSASRDHDVVRRLATRGFGFRRPVRRRQQQEVKAHANWRCNHGV